MTFTVHPESKSLLAKKVLGSAFVQRDGLVVSDPAQAWDRLFHIGDEIRKQTGVTRDDIKAMVADVRACKS